MNKEEIESKLRSFVTKGAEVSKEMFEKAGDKVQDFSDKSLIKLEKKQLESKQEKKFSELGCKLYELIKTAKITVAEEYQENINILVAEIDELSDAIKQKENLLK